MKTYINKTPKGKNLNQGKEDVISPSNQSSPTQLIRNPAKPAILAIANASPQVQQLKSMQQMADEKLQAEQNLTPTLVQKKENNTGLPNQLKAGIENLSGYVLDDVKVHYNSPQPAQLQAHAYAQGTDIHVAPGQEQHLPHEAWHVVQQKQGRVQPTLQMKGDVNVNDDAGLENEADLMGAKAMLGINATSKKEEQPSSAATQLVIQREVSKERSGPNKGKFYTTYDLFTHFNTYQEAKNHQDLILIQIEINKENLKRQKHEEEMEKRRALLNEKYKDYKIPESKTARLFKYGDSEFDDVPLTTLNPENVKTFMEKKFAERWTGDFKAQVINLGGFHHVIAPGTDIGLTPTNLRPELQKGHKFIPLSRQGSAKPYNDLAHGLDEIVEKYAKINEATLEETRERVGKDIERFTRGNQPSDEHEYTSRELEILNEVAGVLRLDKGRVPKATRYIRNTLTGGLNTFKQLLVDKYYVGAGEGGVQALRGKVEDEGELSQGSDIEDVKEKQERKNKKKRKRTLSLTDSKDESEKKKLKEKEDHSEYLEEVNATLLLWQNNCLINAISQSSFARNATLEQLVEIRAELDNVGEMMAATEQTINVIRRVLGINHTINVRYRLESDGINERFGPVDGVQIEIYHTGGLHFQENCPDVNNYDLGDI